ncbi:uncharacterized protein LOC128546784 [Mercenaria mercenaria]|uniref:uncharacterized protein LOC128546784 n=1 Tax=Mercenaria mercenaria TaxID=6596 RepID=UPI00234EF9F6|nr:uncharacterized protein LOC128546784 [Mercenaria mercenaria]
MHPIQYQRIFILAYLLSVAGTEPQCSKFHFEEKLLEKSVRMELKMSSLHEELADMRERVSTLENKQDMIITPTVVFTARGPNNLRPLDGQLIVFKTTVMNLGSGYDNLTGVFTAPHKGIYLFTTQFCIPPGSRYMYSAIVHEDVTVKGSLIYDNNSDFCTSADVIVGMKKEERVWVKCVRTSSKSSDVLRESETDWNTFSGVLLHK